jgi:hypothetical protein
MSFLVLEPIAADGLADRSFMMSMSPFVQLHLEDATAGTDTKVRTTAAEGAGTRPRWARSQRNKLVQRISENTSHAVIEVRNQQFVMQSVLLGRSRIDLAAVVAGESVASPMAIQLEAPDSNSGSAGALTCRMYTTDVQTRVPDGEDDELQRALALSRGNSFPAGPASFTGEGRALGGGEAAPAAVSAREAAALAAERRAQGTTVSARDRKLADRRRRDELVGRIEAHYRATGREPPIGLASCDADQLKRHLAHAKGESSRHAKAGAIRQQKFADV